MTRDQNAGSTGKPRVASELVELLGAEGTVTPGMRRGLPDHIDGVPVRTTVHVLRLPRWRSLSPEPLPMIELRDDEDGGSSVEARWPTPRPEHDLGHPRDT